MRGLDMEAQICPEFNEGIARFNDLERSRALEGNKLCLSLSQRQRGLENNKDVQRYESTNCKIFASSAVLLLGTVLNVLRFVGYDKKK